MKFNLMPLAGMAMIVGAGAAPAFADTLVVPGSVASADANSSNLFPFFNVNTMRYQQVFNTSAFSSLTGPVLITGFDLRNDGSINRSFSYSIPSVGISLSTTGKAADGLSTTFANNIGADVTQVFNGALTLSSAGGTSGAGSTPPFDISVAFANSFFYDPTAGNLLLDVLKTSVTSDNSIFVDAQDSTTDAISRVYASNLTAPTGTANTRGLVVRFHTTAAPMAPAAAVPEPTTWAMMILGMGAIGFAMRRQKVATRLSFAA